MGLSRQSGRWLGVFVSGLWLGACSGKANTPSSAAGGSGGASGDLALGGEGALAGHAGSVSAGGSVAQGGSVAAAGSSAAARNPDLVEAPDDTCERFHFTQGVCTAECPAWPCDPTVFNVLGPVWCNANATAHCLTGFDCAAAAEDATRGTLSSCLASYPACASDADCPSDARYCVIDARYTTGSCDTGLSGMRCREDDDCRPGSLCIANAADGTRGCSDGAEGSLCNVDAECQGKRCIHEPGVSINGLNPDPKPALVGVCSTGEPGKRCFTGEYACPPNFTCSIGVNDGECLGGAHCVRDSDGNMLCSSG